MAARAPLLVALLFVLGTGVARLSAQVMLDFDDLSFANYDPVAPAYGDGLDVNIPDIQYRTYLPDGVTLHEDHLELWLDDYGDLTKVLFPSANGSIGEITFVPAPGYGVRLVSFAMAGWPLVDRVNTVLRILDSAGNVVLDFAADGPVPVLGSGGAHSVFTPNLAVAGALRLQWGTDWNVGLDNIVFESVPLAAIPEPGTLALLSLGLGALLLRRRVRRRAQD